MTTLTIDEQLSRARRGDAHALSSVLVELTPRLVRMVELRLDAAQRRRFEPADVVQDALVEATRRFPEWCGQDRYPFHVWLRLLTSQSLARLLRHHVGAQMRDPAREEDFERDRTSVTAENAADWLVSRQTSPTQAAHRSELRTRVLSALEELDELDREILALRTFEQLSNEEAASELGIDPSAASKRFTRALQRMRPALRALEPSDDQAQP
jgi:RNA polymerase sigma-70 factor (ECF subfamily)